MAPKMIADAPTHGSAADIVRLNACKVLAQYSFLIRSGFLFKIYGCFLLGLYIGRHEIYKKLEQLRPILPRLAIGGFAIGLPLNILFAASFETDSWLEILSNTFGVLPMSCGYVAWWCWMWVDSGGRGFLRHFAPVGRMALTNYVGQSVISVLLFRAVGLGLGGTMGPTQYMPIAVAIYAAQMLLSRWWLARFRFGPLEWLWRMLTYGEWLPLRRPVIAAL